MLTITQALHLGVQHHRTGNLPQAEQIYRDILQVDPFQADVLHLLGLIALQVGKSDIAVDYMGQALLLQPRHAEAHNNLGVALQQQGKLDEAIASYQQALRLQPGYADAHNNLGNVFKEQGQFEKALASYQQALRLRPNDAETHANLGNIFQQQGRFTEAMASYQQALHLQPGYADVHNNLGVAHQQQGQFDEAITNYQQALRFKPDYAEAHNNLGSALKDRGQFEEAVASLQQALRLQPNYAEAHNNLGNIFQQQGKPAEAVASYQQALRLRPNFVEAHNNLGFVLQQQGKLTEALASYHQALHFQPDYAEAHWNRALAWLLAGNYEQGLPEYEWRWRRNGMALPSFPQPLWEGGPLEGRTILLQAEQGLGDTLQFIRYAPLVQARGGSVLLACPAALIPLLSSCRGIERLLAEESSLPPFDVYAPLMSLPRIFGTTPATVPAQVPYLFADAALSNHWRQQRRSWQAFTIGIAWQGNPNYRGDRQRSIPLAQFAPLAALPGVQLVSLQKGPGTEQLRAGAGQFPVLDLESQLDETSGAFMGTAAVMQNLDLVITSDTAIAHLAGALGVPVWVALPFVPDWRWLLDREDSPWYPTMRLFRQQEWGHWPEVFARMAAEVKPLLAVDEGTSLQRR